MPLWGLQVLIVALGRVNIQETEMKSTTVYSKHYVHEATHENPQK